MEYFEAVEILRLIFKHKSSLSDAHPSLQNTWQKVDQNSFFLWNDDMPGIIRPVGLITSEFEIEVIPMNLPNRSPIITLIVDRLTTRIGYKKGLT